VNAFEKRLSDLAGKLGGSRPYCRDCQNEKRYIVIAEDPDGGAPTVNGERCPTCGSPDAMVIRIVYDDVQPPRPNQSLKPRYLWES
jgi:hypothetical protein